MPGCMGLAWITLVWVQSNMTPTFPFCMVAVLHCRPGSGPECGLDRRRGVVNWKAKLDVDITGIPGNLSPCMSISSK